MDSIAEKIRAFFVNLLSTWPGVFLGAFLLIAAAVPSRLLLDPGTFWHIRTGEWMLDHGRVLTFDPFSVLHQGEEWLPTQWLAEILMALVYRAGGFPLLVIVAAAICSCLLAFIASLFFKARLLPIAAWFLTAMVFMGVSDQFHVRPLLATLFGTALLTALLLSIEYGKYGIKSLVYSFPLAVLWANMHGGYLGAVAMIGFAWLGWGARIIIWKDGPIKSSGGFLWLTLGLASWLAAPLVSPFGYRLPSEWLRIWFQLDLGAYVIEHRPSTLSTGSFRVAILFGGVLLFLFLKLGKELPLSASRYLPLPWFYMAWQRGRNCSLFVSCAAVVLAEMLEKTTNRGKWFSSWSVERADQPRLAAKLLAFTFPLLFALAGWFGVYSPGLDTTAWPTDLIPALQKLNKEVPKGSGIYNEFGDGGFLIFYAPNFRVFNDDRCELYGSDWQKEQLNWEGNKPEELEKRIRPAKIRHAFVRKDTPVHQELAKSSHWESLGSGETAEVFKRRD